MANAGAKGHGNDSFRKSTPEERAMRANQRPSQIDVHNSMSPVHSRGMSRGFVNSPSALKSVMSNSRTAYTTASQGPRSPFSIPHIGTSSTYNGGNVSPTSQKEQIDIMSPTGGRGHLQRRSTLQPPPIGERNQAWGKYDTVQEIMSRPLPPPPVELGQHKTMSLQGGRWSYHQPVNHMYVLSRTSLQSPGPGHYGQSQPNGDWGAPDPVITGKTTPFGRIMGGRVSVSPLRAHSHDLCRVAKSVPGPGAYDTDHLFGIYARIVSAIPKSRKEMNDVSMYADYAEEYAPDSDADSTPRGGAGGGDTSYTMLDGAAQYFDDTTAWSPDPIFDDGKETDLTRIEQRLVMSQAVPLEKMPRLGTTRYSRLRKDATRPRVRKIWSRNQDEFLRFRSQSAMG